MRDWFMLEKGKHHRVDEGLWLHYPGTCNVHDVDVIGSGESPWAPRSTQMDEIRFATSDLGLVAVCYEKKGRMTFMVQLDAKRVAWQRIGWHPDYQTGWDDDEVQRAIRNFLWVAQCEEARQLLPR
jgi:hypothetical protein